MTFFLLYHNRLACTLPGEILYTYWRIPVHSFWRISVCFIILLTVIYGEEYTLLTSVILVYCILFLISTAINLIYAYIWQTLNNQYVVKIKTDMYEKLLRSKAKYLSNLNTGDAVARVEWDSDQFIHVIQKNVFHFTNSIIMCIAILIMICKTSLVIGIIAILSVVIPFIITKILSKKNRENN